MNEIKSKLDTILAMMLSGAGGGGGSVDLDVFDEDIALDSLAAQEEKKFEIPFANAGIMKSINFKTEEESPFTIIVRDGPSGRIEYISTGNIMYCYDIVDVLYIDKTDSETLYLTVRNDSDSPINFEHAIIRGLIL